MLGVFLLIYSVGSTLIYEFQYALTKDGLTPEEVTKQKMPYFCFGVALLLIATTALVFRKKKE